MKGKVTLKHILKDMEDKGFLSTFIPEEIKDFYDSPEQYFEELQTNCPFMIEDMKEY